MRRMLAGLMLTLGVIGSIYVPGEIRDGIYVRPHFVAAPDVKYSIWPNESVGPERPSDRQSSPLLDLPPPPDRDKLGEES
jgi:hypothetical protein